MINRYNQNVKEDNSANAQILKVLKLLNLKQLELDVINTTIRKSQG
jgi:hypothetical protein